jgi:hypothetical protein
MRLILHTAAYWLMLTLRDAIPKAHALATAEFNTIRLRLLKLGARVVEMASRVRLAFAAAAHFDPPHRGCADADRAVNDGAAIAPVTRPENLQRLPKDQSRGETDAAGDGARNRHTPPSLRASRIGSVSSGWITSLGVDQCFPKTWEGRT